MPAHIPGISYDAYFEIADAFAPFVRTEREQHSFDFIGHVAREFEGIAFTAAKDAVFAENRRNNVQNSQESGITRARRGLGLAMGRWRQRAGSRHTPGCS